MKAHKLSISLSPDLGQAVRDAAFRSGRGLSWWVSEAIAARLRAEALDDFLEEWQQAHGAITPDELAKAEAELGFRGAGSGRDL